MTVEIYWTARDHKGLPDIYLSIAVENKTTAQRVAARLRARAEALAAYPRLGPKRDDIRRGMRMLVERPYLVFYSLKPELDEAPAERIDIVRVLDGRRDLLIRL